MIEVAFVYNVYPHYRAGIVSAIAAQEELSPIFVAADVTTWNSVKTTAIWRGFDHSIIRLKRIGPFEVQLGLITFVIRRWKSMSTIVFLGNPYYLSVWIAAIMCRLGGKRVLFWTHGWIKTSTSLKERIRDIFLRIPHGLLLYGNEARKIGIDRGFNPSKLYVIWNSLDYDKQRALRIQLQLTSRSALRLRKFNTAKHVLICTGRLTTQCKFEQLLEAEVILRTKGVLCKVVLVGNGPSFSKLAQLAAQLDTDINFVGETYDESALAELLYASDITVCPGKMGLTAMHSLAYGTPVISHSSLEYQMPEVEAIIPGKTGNLFARNDATDLAAKIEEMLVLLETDNQRIHANCISMIEKRYNPTNQARIISLAVAGKNAEDCAAEAFGL